ncbi:Ku protein [Streptomyces sp. NPDC056269]|uniref:Ku protein n=1 Tax=Streptomyces sp. NPDC056269 TaxID=3345768 RepID=UPI0035E15924
MPRVMWNGAISFGPAAVPITLEPSTESHGMPFRQVHLEHGGRVRYQKRCAIDGQTLTEDDPMAFGADDYDARPKGDVAAQPYTLLRQALSRTDKVAVVNYALRGHPRLWLLRPVGEALSSQGLRWDGEIRSPPETMTVASLTYLAVIDHYTEALHEVIEAKAEHRAPRPTEGVHTMPKPKKKGAAKKAAPARKTAGKKTTAAQRRKSA